MSERNKATETLLFCKLAERRFPELNSDRMTTNRMWNVDYFVVASILQCVVLYDIGYYLYGVNRSRFHAYAIFPWCFGPCDSIVLAIVAGIDSLTLIVPWNNDDL